MHALSEYEAANALVLVCTYNETNTKTQRILLF